MKIKGEFRSMTVKLSYQLPMEVKGTAYIVMEELLSTYGLKTHIFNDDGYSVLNLTYIGVKQNPEDIKEVCDEVIPIIVSLYKKIEDLPKYIEKQVKNKRIEQAKKMKG